jgi:signal transduction histidine kinase
MLDSLRSRLLVWYTAILAVVIAVFGGTVSLLVWRARIADVDATLRARAEALVAALEPVGGGRFDLTLPPDPPESPLGGVPLYHALWTEAGSVIDLADPELDVRQPDAPGARYDAGRREIAVHAPVGAIVLVGRDLADVRGELLSLAGIIGGVGLAALGLSLAGGWILVGRALAPVDRISQTAQRMIDGDFSARIAVDRVETEFGRLARALNRAFDHLHTSLARQQRFTADASHELRTPLAALSTEVQWALGRERQPAEYRSSLEVALRAARRMQAIVERLLVLARADAGTDLDRTTRVQLDELVREVVTDLEPLAAARQLDVRVTAEPVTVRADPSRIVEAVSNLVDNAIQYNVDGGQLRVVVSTDADGVTVTVEDTGVGIDAGDLEHVFEPFYRGDPARSRDAGGAGLGLTVARAIAQQHGGDLMCTSRPGAGTAVTLRLPALDAGASPG